MHLRRRSSRGQPARVWVVGERRGGFWSGLALSLVSCQLCRGEAEGEEGGPETGGLRGAVRGVAGEWARWRTTGHWPSNCLHGNGGACRRFAARFSATCRWIGERACLVIGPLGSMAICMGRHQQSSKSNEEGIGRVVCMRAGCQILKCRVQCINQ